MRMLKFVFVLITLLNSFAFGAEPEVAPATEARGLMPASSPDFRATPEAAAYGEFCPGIRMMNIGDFAFSDMERRLVCGDSSGGQIGTPWATIPANQAAFFFKSFFQSRGYHEPEFRLDREILFVKPGPSARLSRFRIVGGPKGWDPPKRRLIEGNLLTPSLLNDLQGWSLSQIKNEGYPCATATVRADPATGEVLVRMDEGELKRFKAIETTGDTGLREETLDRYNAFRIGDIYRENLVTLTRRRVIEDGFSQTVSMTTRCEPDGAVVVRDVVLGPSRTIRVGVGASTDLGARVRAIVSQNRIGDSASNMSLTAKASYLREEVNQQSVVGDLRWYYSPGEARNYIRPEITYEHVATDPQEYQTMRFQALHGWNREFPRGQASFEIGPNILDSQVSRGVGPSRSTTTFIATTTTWHDHDHEFFVTSPRTGERLELTTFFTSENFGANFTAQRFRLQGQKLWNLLRYDPPFFILGLRFDLSSVFSGDPNITSDLPPQFLTYLGGERDLRGFEQGSLPRSRIGALSGASSGLEARFHRVLFRRADIFSFVDAGMLGQANFDLARPIFMSPGLGVRWESPFGVLRVYGAHRFALQEVAAEEPYGSDWRLGFTFGEEF